MSFIDLFRPVSEWTVERVREYLGHHHPDEYHLLDVRMLVEYSEQHLPGAHWIPADDLPKRIAELDPARTTIVYCTSGIRSRSVTAILNRAGFADVHSMHGGLRAWQGHLATGLPEAEFDQMFADRSAEEVTAMAWQMEENTRSFYERLADERDDPVIAAQFAELAAAEKHHKAMLLSVWEGLAGRPAPERFPDRQALELVGDRLEGGVCLEDVLAWVEEKPADELLELAMAIEINAYDTYLTLYRSITDENTRRVFELLAIEERNHLKALGHLLEKHLPII